MSAEKQELTPDQLLKQAEVALAKSVEYIAAAQPQLDKYAEFKTAFQKKAEETAKTLVTRGIITQPEADMLVKKLAEDQTLALNLVTRLAELVVPESLGRPSDDVKQASDRRDPFTRLCYPNSNDALTVE